VRRVGLLDRTEVFDRDDDLHRRIESVFARIMASPPPSPGPPREEMLRRLGVATPSR
jgi:hypothetical protein